MAAMFTGIIQDIGTIKEISRSGDYHMVVETNMDLSMTMIGASICCSGCCLTVVEKGKAEDKNWFGVDVSGETLSKTSLKSWEEGTKINLEPSLKLGDELGGHFVFGHVDGLANIIEIKKEKDSHRLLVQIPDDLVQNIASKGSVALDGISLTVNEVEGNVFGVNIIAHTWAVTNLSERKTGDFVNFEVDMLSRYVGRQMEYIRGAA